MPKLIQLAIAEQVYELSQSGGSTVVALKTTALPHIWREYLQLQFSKQVSYKNRISINVQLKWIVMFLPFDL